MVNGELDMKEWEDEEDDVLFATDTADGVPEELEFPPEDLEDVLRELERMNSDS